MSRLSRSRTIVLAALLGLGTVLLPGQSAGAAPTGTAGLSAECADIVVQAAAASTAGAAANETAGCIENDTSPAAAVSINATQCSVGTWTVTRTTVCVVRSLALTVFNVQSRAVIGRIYFTLRNEAVTNPKSSTFTQTITFIPNRTRSWGIITGTHVTAEASCSGSCSTDSGFLAPRNFLAPGPGPTATATFRTTVSAIDQTGLATPTWKFWFLNVNWVFGRSNSLSTPVSNQVRCDNALGGITSVGCVFPDRKPTLKVDTINATYHRHIQLALQYHMPGLLTRMQNPALQQRNRDWACPEAPPRPDSYSCDEYPFASTWEGAYTGNHPFGRTFDGCQLDDWLRTRTFNDGGLGFNACMIVNSDNSRGGTELGEFYNNNRVINGDRFFVTVA